jgi:peptidoglycan/xylan/chitin deacetylase (PgdA/CDA1 family)
MRKSWMLCSWLALLMAGCVGAEEGEDFENLSEAWEQMQNDDGSADSSRCSGVIVPDRGPFSRAVALTFDDGPSLRTTPQVLEVLRRHNAVGTFFINGSKVGPDERALLQEMVAAGHIVANHTTNHPNSVQVSIDRFRTEVEGTHNVIEQIGMAKNARFFRFPFGSANCSTVDLVKSYGYSVVGWHIDTADWCFAAGGGYCKASTFRYVPDQYRNDYPGFTVRQAQDNGGGVLLMHDIHAFTVGQLDAVLTALEGAGFHFVPLSDGTTFPALNSADPGEAPWVGTPCTDDTACNFSYQDRQGRCMTYDGGGFCILDCAGSCPDRYGHATTFCVASQSGAGMCVPKAEELNGQCASIPGTAATDQSRYVGSSGASTTTATVCLPAQ